VIKKYQEIIFILLGFSIPISTAAISFFFILFILLSFLEGEITRKISFIKKNKVSLSILAIFILHLLGFLYLDVQPENGLKSWMFFSVPLLATVVDDRMQKYGTLSFLVGSSLMSLATLFLLLNNFDIITAQMDFDHNPSDELYISTGHIALGPIFSFAAAYSLMLFFRGDQCYSKLFFLFFVVNFLAVFFILGRTGYFISLIIVPYILVKLFKKGDIKFLISVIFTGLIFIVSLNFSPFIKERVKSFQEETVSYLNSKNPLNESDTSTSQRINYALNSMKIALDSPIIGFGTGSFKNTFIDKLAELKGDSITDNPHNQYVLIFFQFGIVGIFFYLLMFFYMLKHSRNQSKKRFKVLEVNLFILFFALIFFFDTYLWEHHLQALFAFFAAIFFRSNLSND